MDGLYKCQVDINSIGTSGELLAKWGKTALSWIRSAGRPAAAGSLSPTLLMMSPSPRHRDRRLGYCDAEVISHAFTTAARRRHRITDVAASQQMRIPATLAATADA